MATVHAVDAAIYYETYGDGPWVTLLHGAGGNASVWFQQIPVFARHWRVIAMDHRGFGLSRCEPEALRVNRFADDLRRVLDAEGVETTALVCQSMGGWTGLRFALDHPDRVAALVMSATPGGVMTDAVKRNFRAAGERARTARSAAEIVLSASFRERERALTVLYEQLGRFNGPTDKVLQQLADPDNVVSLEALRGLQLPVLFVAGDSDPIFPPAALKDVAGLVPGAALQTMSTGHSPFFEQPHAFNAVVEAFLSAAFEVSG